MKKEKMGKKMRLLRCLWIFLAVCAGVFLRANASYAENETMQEPPEASDSQIGPMESTEPVDGLVKEDGTYHYYRDGQLVTESWITVDGARYYFKKSGSAAAGITVLKGKFYHFNANGKYNVRKTKKLRKAAIYKNPFSALKRIIGKPKKAKYFASCFGKGKDGILKYSGFTVYTFKPSSGKEIFMGVD